MIKGFRQIAILTLVSRIFGFVREMVYCYFLGAGTVLDAWFVAFKIPNLSRRLFGEGAASASFIPVYSESLHKGRQKASQLANTVVTVVFVLLAVIVLLGQAGIWLYYKFFSTTSETKLILSLSSIMLPYMVLVCTVAILGGILNVHRHFASPAAAPAVLNIFIIGSLLLTGWSLKLKPQEQVFAIALAVLIAGLVQIAMQIPALRAHSVQIRPAWDVYSGDFKKIIVLMGPMILGLTVTQINTLADDIIAWWFSGSDEKGKFFMFFASQIRYPLWRGSVTHLNLAQRLYQFPLGIFGISLATAIFPVMSSDAVRKDFAKLSKTISQGLRGAIFIAVPATVGLIMVARPLITVWLQRGRFLAKDTEMVAWTLLFYSLGLTGFFMQQILTRAFYSMQDSKMPMRSALVAVCVNLVLNMTLIWFLGTGGLACSTAICSYLQVVILFSVLRGRLGTGVMKGLGSGIIKTVVATAMMAAAGLTALWLSAGWADIFKLILTIPIAAAVYWLAAKLLRIEMLGLLIGSKSRGNAGGLLDE